MPVVLSNGLKIVIIIIIIIIIIYLFIFSLRALTFVFLEIVAGRLINEDILE